MIFITIKQHVSGINHVSKESKVLVYGANGDINVRGTEGGESIVVYNIYGSIVTRTVATGDLTTINVPNGGIYIVRVLIRNGDNGLILFKIIKGQDLDIKKLDLIVYDSLCVRHLAV